MPKLPPEQIAYVAHKAGFRGEDLVTSVAIALAESGGDSDAQSPLNKNGSKDFGLWQINNPAHAGLFGEYRWQDPYQNAQMAWTVYKGEGFRAWSVYKNNKFRDFLNEARRGAQSPTPPIEGKPAPSIPGSDGPGQVLGAAKGVASALGDIAKALANLPAITTKILWLFVPSNAMRVVIGFFGVAFLFVGIFLVGKEANARG